MSESLEERIRALGQFVREGRRETQELRQRVEQLRRPAYDGPEWGSNLAEERMDRAA